MIENSTHVARNGDNKLISRYSERSVGQILAGLIGIMAVAVTFRLFLPASIAPFSGGTDGVTTNSIAVAERWPINGVDQAVVIRGSDVSNPVLIWVGDLECETPVLRHYNAELENHFVVVYWCQRYSGQSLDPFSAPPARLTIAQYVADLGVLVERVCARFHKDRVALVAHSSGTIFGLLYAQRHPEHVAAYVGVGQVVNPAESLKRAFRFALGEAHARNDAQALAELTQLGAPPYGAGGSAILRKWVIAFGGAFHANLSYGKLALISVFSGDSNWRDAFAFLRGGDYTAAIEPEMNALQLDKGDLKFDVPIFLLMGRYDHRTDSALAHDYFDSIKAPRKAFVWFNHSAHSPPFEEPDAFNAWIAANIRPLAASRR